MITVKELRAICAKAKPEIPVTVRDTVTLSGCSRLLGIPDGTLRDWRTYGCGPKSEFIVRVEYKLTAIADWWNTPRDRRPKRRRRAA